MKNNYRIEHDKRAMELTRQYLLHPLSTEEMMEDAKHQTDSPKKHEEWLQSKKSSTR